MGIFQTQAEKPTLRLPSTLKLNKLLLTILILVGCICFCEAQDCTFRIAGQITDEHRGTPISHANIWVEELEKGVISNDSGYYSIDELCAGEYHLVVSHFGCPTQEHFVELVANTTFNMLMDHSGQFLDEVLISTTTEKKTTQSNQSISEDEVVKSGATNLGTIVSRTPGVSAIRNGSTIAKPVIHGLYGNRVLIMNNGVPQSGQQWGQDHSPEIDPLVANNIRVIKGVGAVEYLGNSLGGVVLVEPRRIPREPHLHGKVRYQFESNGLANGLNFQLQQFARAIGWRMIGTVRKGGDRHTPDYYLRNTGNEEANLAIQLEYNPNDSWRNNLYLSSYNARLGVLRGAHIGNLSDLEAALELDEPLFTEEEFSFGIDAPFQQVNHQLVKLESKFLIDDHQWISTTVSAQYNQRKEFDIRRGGRTDTPALSINQLSTFGEVKYHLNLSEGKVIKTGLQINRTDNANDPETGILPLIPDYIAYEYGGFALFTKQGEMLSFEIGGRYDIEDRRVVTISGTIPKEIIRYNRVYSNYAASTGIRYSPKPNLDLNLNIGASSRAPEVNELYSNGLHQGVSGIEEGDPDLSAENSIKTTLGVETRLSKKWTLSVLAYYQNISDYIFLEPQDEIRLTIRGAFPVFAFAQTDATLWGSDIVLSWQASEHLSFAAKYSYLIGNDLNSDLSIINLPANRLTLDLNASLGDVGTWENLELQLSNTYVFKQSRITEGQDFVLPPDAYNLVSALVSAEKQLLKVRLNVFAGVDNALNTQYRDYLNRLRYFADDLGINGRAGVSIAF
jgi:iron complex outermembrane receptor protein